MSAVSTYGVLTGDLVGSRDLSPDQLAIVRARLLEAAARCAAWQDGLMIGVPRFFRGDSWQLALAVPGEALRVALVIRAALIGLGLGIDSRIAIGIGAVDRLNSEDVSLSVGDAFTRSGAALDAMKGDGLVLAMDGLAPADRWRAPMVEVCGALIGRFVPWHAEIAWRWIAPHPPSQKSVSEDLAISPASVSEAVRLSGVRELAFAARAFAES